MKKRIMLIMVAIIVIISSCSGRASLTGNWEFLSGDNLFFFGNSGIIAFDPGTTVVAYDRNGIADYNDLEDGLLRLFILGHGHADFTFEIRNNRLTITDRAGNTATYQRRN